MLIGILQWMVILSLSLGAWALLRQARRMTRGPARRDDADQLLATGHQMSLGDAAEITGADTKPLGILG